MNKEIVMAQKKIQLSVFVPNRLGELTKITNTLSRANINLEALTIAETKDFGVLRIIADDTERAYTELTKHGFVAKKSPVIAVPMENKPGALDDVLAKLAAAEIAVEYIYSSAGQDVFLIFKVNDIDKAEAILQ
jgi:hypothetical protein